MFAAAETGKLSPGAISDGADLVRRATRNLKDPGLDALIGQIWVMVRETTGRSISADRL